MNVYDFDGTIYKGDSSLDFYWYCLKKHPTIIGCFPKQFSSFILLILGCINRDRFKEKFFSYVELLSDIDSDICCFWDINETKIQDWYKRVHKSSDVIISASPRFLLEEICRRLNIRYLIATNMNKCTGLIDGNNCKGDEKVKQFSLAFPNTEIHKFYSDSLSDTPMAKISNSAYFVKGKNIKVWDFRR